MEFPKTNRNIRKMHQRYDTTIIIISHQERILRLADEVILVDDGTITELHPVKSF